VRKIARIAAMAIAACSVASARGLVAPLDSQADLNTFMKGVLERRDENWKKLQQYILDETEKIEVLGLGGMRMWGQHREYQWFIREGYFVKSPVTSDGVKISDRDRQKYEDDFFQRQKTRDKRRAEEAAKKAAAAGATGAAADVPPPAPPETGGGVDAIIKQTAQPQFIDSAYFMEFKFDGGQYALAGKEQFEGHDVLRIEYYPQNLFHSDGERKKREEANKPTKGDQFEKTLDHLMNKNSLVTLWVEPKTKQIVKYTFDNVQLDFLPVAWLARMEALRATMTMSEPFKGVWLPRDVEIQFSALLAVGPFDVHYRLEYVDYREAITSGRIKKDPTSSGRSRR
jgi:hypothetical protein